jgi:hypothetical protein
MVLPAGVSWEKNYYYYYYLNFFSVGALSQVTPSELGTSLALPWRVLILGTPHVCSITLLLLRLE